MAEILSSWTEPQQTFETASDVPLTAGEAFELSSEKGYIDSLGGVFFGTLGIENTGKTISPEDAKLRFKEAGLPESSAPTEPVDEAKFQYMYDIQTRRAYIDSQLSRGGDNAPFFSPLAGSFYGGFSDPTTLATGLIGLPETVVGKLGATIAGSIGKGVGANIAGRAAAAGIAGAVEQTAIEPFYARYALDRGDDYTIFNSFQNIAFSSVLPATLGGIGGVVNAVRGKYNIHPDISIGRMDDVNDVLETAAKQFSFSGKIEVADLMNNVFARKHGFTLDEVLNDPKMREALGSPEAFKNLVNERLDIDAPSSLKAELESLKLDLGQAESRVLEIEKANLEDLNSVKEVDYKADYAKYKKSAEGLDDPKKKPATKENLKSKMLELDAKHGGSLSVRYDTTTSNIKSAQQVVKDAQDTLKAKEKELIISRVTRQVLNDKQAALNIESAKSKSFDVLQSRYSKLEKQANDIIQNSNDKPLFEIEDAISSMEDAHNRFIEKHGIDLSDTNEVPLEVSTIKDLAKTLADCGVKNGF